MKKLVYLTSFVLYFSIMVNGQVKTNLIFFTEQSEKFSVVLNGVLQNAKPETNIKVTDLIAPNYKLKIKFADPKLGEIDKNLMFNQGTEATFVIRKNNKGEYVVRFMNEVPIAQAQPNASGQEVIVYTTTPAVTTTTYTQSQTTTVSNGNNINPGNGSVSIGVNVNDANMNINMNLGENINGGSTTTTTTTTTTTSNVQTNDMDDNHSKHEQHKHDHQNTNAYVMPGYNGEVGCPWPMSQNDFQGVKNSISSKSFEDSKLTIAKQVIKSNCLLSAQVKEIMLLFSFESTRLDLAKFAYGYTYDISNYYKLNDAFSFESSIDELNKYIGGYSR